MDEFLAKVLEAAGKTREEFDREVEELKNKTDASQTLQRIEQQQAETSAILLEFIEAMTGGA